MPIVFEGEPPYETLFATKVASEPTPGGVVLTLTIVLDEPLHANERASVPVRIVLEPKDARSLCPLLCTQAGVVEQWQKSGFEG